MAPRSIRFGSGWTINGSAEERYRTLVEQLPAVVYIDAIDEFSTALYISPQYERIFGFSPQERTGDPGLWMRQIYPEDRERVLTESARTDRTRCPVPCRR